MASRLIRYILLGILSFYQKFLSPLKRGRCAYGALHGNGTCSSRTKGFLRTLPLDEALRATRDQVHACKMAAASRRAGALGFVGASYGGGGGGGYAAEEENACCEIIYDLGDGFARLITGIYAFAVAIKYTSVLSYRFSNDGFFSDVAFDLVGPVAFGAAASSLWPVMVLAMYLDYRILTALYRGASPTPAVIGLFLLSMIVMVEDWILFVALGDLDSLRSGLVGAVRDGYTASHASALIYMKNVRILGLWWLPVWWFIASVAVIIAAEWRKR